MDLTRDRVCVAPGDGIVARQGGTLLFIEATAEARSRVADELLSVVDAHEGDARRLVRAVGAIVTSSEVTSVPSFGLLVQDGGEVIVLACGDAWIEVTATDETHVVRGTDASTYVERVLTGDLVDAWLTGSGVRPDPRSRLTSGVVRGGGAQVVGEPVPVAAASPVVAGSAAMAGTLQSEDTRSSEATPPPSSVPEEPPTPEFESISLFTADAPAADPQVTDSTEPDPGSAGTAVTPPVPSSAVMVDGIYCSRDHFNNPGAIFCTLCGISMVHQTHNLMRGPRPPLGVLLTDTGDVFVLSRDYVVGREPGTAPEVVSGASLPLELVDEEGTMSRVHARILLDGWEVRVSDASSANGTFMSVDGSEWSRLEPERPVTISPGVRISMGARTLAFETHQHG